MPKLINVILSGGSGTRLWSVNETVNSVIILNVGQVQKIKEVYKQNIK